MVCLHIASFGVRLWCKCWQSVTITALQILCLRYAVCNTKHPVDSAVTLSQCPAWALFYFITAVFNVIEEITTV